MNDKGVAIVRHGRSKRNVLVLLNVIDDVLLEDMYDSDSINERDRTVVSCRCLHGDILLHFSQWNAECYYARSVLADGSLTNGVH